MTRVFGPLARALLLVELALAGPASAQEAVANFYKGRAVTLLIGVNVGASYDLEGRLIARHLGRFIPGNPTIVPQNMLGGGGIVMANYMQAIAPRDGSYLAMAPNTLPMAQAVGLEGVKFELGAFNWLGSVMPMAHSALIASSASGVKTFEELRKREVTNGASPKGSFTYTMPALLNDLAGAKLKIVAGYQGINTIYLALERGEVDTVAVTWNDFEKEKADLIRDGKARALVQSSPPSPTLPATPVVEDLLANAGDKPLVDLLLSGNRIGRPLATSPGAPAPRVAALREAFESMRRDPVFLEDARKSGVDVGGITGLDIQREIAGILAAPPEIAGRARKILE